MNRSTTLAAAALALLLPGASPAGAQRIENPDLFGKSLTAAQQALEHYGSYDDPEDLARVTDIGYRIAQESGYQDFPLTFHLIDMAVPNAFALPGGQVFITRGMLDLGLDDDMLGALLGHEIAHVVLRHGIRMQRRATLLNAISQALLVGVMVGTSGSSNNTGVYGPYDPRAGGSNRGDLIQGTAAAGAVVSELLLRSYSREFEDEADEEGQRWAAGVGYSPDGTYKLMSKMSARLPESREYGYWQTHPFLTDRAQAARARGELLKPLATKDADAYRARTQAALLEYGERPKLTPEVVALLKQEALAAWPKGARAEGLRLENLHDLRDQELARRPFSQDLGKLLAAYRKQEEAVRSLTPESPLLPTLATEMGELEERRTKIYPEATKVLAAGIYETEFLETFLSNFPTSPEASDVALDLGDAYSRLGRQSDAVAYYLKAWEQSPESAPGQRALRGLRNLAPYLGQLGALQQLALQDDDAELQGLASQRLGEMVTDYRDLDNGAEYLRRFPDGPHAEAVTLRLNSLADGLFGEVVLYQTVGDHVKALERIQKILTYAPLSPAADRLRARVEVQS